MPTLQDVAGDTGIFTDGNWILSENMDAGGKYGVIQFKHVGIGNATILNIRLKFNRLCCHPAGIFLRVGRVSTSRKILSE